MSMSGFVNSEPKLRLRLIIGKNSGHNVRMHSAPTKLSSKSKDQRRS